MGVRSPSRSPPYGRGRAGENSAADYLRYAHRRATPSRIALIVCWRLFVAYRTAESCTRCNSIVTSWLGSWLARSMTDVKSLWDSIEGRATRDCQVTFR